MNLMVQFMQKPYVEHLNVFNQILRYVARTKDLDLKYSKLPSFVLFGFSYSNYGGNRDYKKSTFAYVFIISSGAISWASMKQTTISLSTIEAKYYAMLLLPRKPFG